KKRNMNEFQKVIDDSLYFINALYTVAEDIAKGNPDNIHLIEREKIKELENRTLAKYNREVYPVAYALMADKNDEKSMKKYLLAIDYTKSLEEGGPDMLLLDTESLEKIGEPYKTKGNFFPKKVRRRFFR
ncbi:MAG: hypothetical protein NTV63_05390, partial [Candidatus Woesearchaeota archaeon]|nr:hypothetical protein [Candidatus Woesearchaeota archaeon]